MYTFVTVVILSMVASSCLKRRQVAGKSPAAEEVCRAGTKPYRDTKGVLLCIVEANGSGKPKRDPNDGCPERMIRNIKGYCLFDGTIECTIDQQSKIIRNIETCVPKEEVAEEQDGEDGEGDETAEQEEGNDNEENDQTEEPQPLLAGVTAKTKLKTITVNAMCVGNNRCFHPQAKELICQANCAKSALGPGYEGSNIVKLVKIDNKGNIKPNNSKLCESHSGATADQTDNNKIECYLAKGGWLFGWGSEKIANDKCKADTRKCPFLSLNTHTIGMKYMCIESLHIDSDPEKDTDKDYLAIHNKKCDAIENSSHKLQLEFSL